ncbi:Hydantoinase B/oxoprolinase [Sulfitobacter brevis]|uniref:Hydantoinase B/oxoprolinase n=1 Tax=Sulfitobacter brevis TaxID=74348 RepID=A0A1I2HKT2_9RHOB|nr:hydantoinase B/oxoprolinase family protein [Sulfitobacter brevis]SFF30108.1 Hydantoinase B/oxoprolinase [Sulfitobacter brevis]
MASTFTTMAHCDAVGRGIPDPRHQQSPCLKFWADISLARTIGAAGAAGGQDGKPGKNSVERANGNLDWLQGNDETQMDVNDVFVMETPGGGGFGS